MYTFILFILLGFISSKVFRYGVFTLVAGFIVFTLSIVIGIIYNLPYPFYMWYKSKDSKVFFNIWKRLIVYTYNNIGRMLEQIIIAYDKIANVWGEPLEDLSTDREDTMFGEDDITISASIGYLEFYHRKQSEFIKGISTALNVVFQQTNHAIGSYRLKLRREETDKLNLLGNKRDNG